MSSPHVHRVQIYYEDTDHSGVVYHANYLKYFERAREHLLGVEELVALYHRGVGFVVYKAEATYREGAEFGDTIEVRTTVRLESEYRLAFIQNIHRPGNDKPIVEGKVELVCVDGARKLVRVPVEVTDRIGLSGGAS